MATVDVRLMGGFEVRLDRRPVDGFESATAEALLARLAVQPGTPLTRTALAELLWPDRAEGKALANLRHSLAVLRRTLGDDARRRPVIVAERDLVAVDAGTVTVDVVEFRRLARRAPDVPGAVAAWESALTLRRGPFLDGFTLSASEEWDTWLLRMRADLDTLAVDVLHRLGELRQRTGERAQALAHARAAMKIDPWDERAHASTIRLLATGGDPTAALALAERYEAELAAGLDARPTETFRSLVEGVRTGRLESEVTDVPGLAALPTVPSTEPVVGRDDELAWLHHRLDDALAGGDGEVFLRGVAGSGKTVLLRAFGVEARERMPELCVLTGAGNAYTGSGDPFLPFRQILGLLCGDLKWAWTQRALTPAGASQLWRELPDVVTVVLDEGPSLLGTLIDAPALESRFLEGYPEHPLGPRLSEAVAEAVRRMDDPTPRSQPILDQVRRVLVRLALRRPMLVLIDDLHWADSGTFDLIRHLAFHTPGARMLLVAAFRPLEMATDATDDPVAVLVDEVQARSKAACVLDVAGTRTFIDAWLDSEPNLLDEEFRDQLHRATHGHALFTVEMVAAMRQRGDLVLDRHGRWTATDAVAWDALSPRIEATIAARARQLSPEAHRDLEVASVQGERFSTRIVADVRGEPLADVVLRLGSLSTSSQALIEPAGGDRVAARGVDSFRFRHALIRQYFDDHLSEPDRSALHETTGRALVELCSDRLDDVAVDLAHHFEAAGVADESIEYHGRAGRRASRLSATVEAIAHLERALELLEVLQPSQDRDRRELDLLTSLGVCLQARFGYNARETQSVYERIRELIPTVGASLETAEALGSLVTIEGLRAHYEEGIAGATHLKEVAGHLGLAPIEAVADTQIGWMLLMTGRLSEAHDRLDGVIEHYCDEWDEWLTYAVGIHVRSTALAWRALAAWHLGRPEQARLDAAAAIDEARRAGYPFALVLALAVGGCGVCAWLGDGECVVSMAAEEAMVAEREGFAFYGAAAQVHLGFGRVLLGDSDDGLREIERGLARWSEYDTTAFLTWLRCMEAESLVAAGRLDEAESIVAEVERMLAEGEEWVAAYYLPVVRAGLARGRRDDATAEAVLRDGITLHKERGAVGPQLRATTALAELLCDDGRRREASEVLGRVLARFTEGADSADVRRAREVLRRASG